MLLTSLHPSHRARHARPQDVGSKEEGLRAALVKNLQDLLEETARVSAVWEDRARAAEGQLAGMSRSMADHKQVTDKLRKEHAATAKQNAQYVKLLENKLAVAEKIIGTMSEREESLLANKKASKGRDDNIIQQQSRMIQLHKEMDAENNNRIELLKAQLAAANLATTLAQQTSDELRGKLSSATAGAQ